MAYTKFYYIIYLFLLSVFLINPEPETAIAMPLKYQNEINNFQLSIPCPDLVSPIVENIYAYRYSFEPITHALNFLPNVVFDRIKPAFFNYAKAKPKKKCNRCGSSFFLSRPLAINNWNALPESIRNNLGYTHLAYGLLLTGDGLISEPDDSSHFGFYEDTNASLHTNFKNIEEI